MGQTSAKLSLKLTTCTPSEVGSSIARFVDWNTTDYPVTLLFYPNPEGSYNSYKCDFTLTSGSDTLTCSFVRAYGIDSTSNYSFSVNGIPSKHFYGELNLTWTGSYPTPDGKDQKIFRSQLTSPPPIKVDMSWNVGWIVPETGEVKNNTLKATDVVFQGTVDSNHNFIYKRTDNVIFTENYNTGGYGYTAYRRSADAYNLNDTFTYIPSFGTDGNLIYTAQTNPIVITNFTPYQYYDWSFVISSTCPATLTTYTTKCGTLRQYEAENQRFKIINAQAKPQLFFINATVTY